MAEQKINEPIIFDLKQLNLSVGSHKIKIQTTAAKYKASPFSNEIEYIIEATAPSTLDEFVLGTSKLTEKKLVSDELLGTWMFSSDASGISGSAYNLGVTDEVYNLAFTSNKTNYKSMSFVEGSLRYDDKFVFETGGPNIVPPVPPVKSSPVAVDKPTVYAPPPVDPGWVWNEPYRTITITDVSGLTNRDKFTTWFKANATKQS